MGTRQHFKASRICSSENYEASRKAYREYINKCHEENIAEIQEITERISITKRCYVSCFGKLIEITKIEALRIEKSVKIIRK